MNPHEYIPRATLAEASRLRMARETFADREREHIASEMRLAAHQKRQRKRREAWLHAGYILWAVVAWALIGLAICWLFWVVAP